MLKGIRDAAGSMLPQMQQQNAIAHNLANARTAGFKRALIVATTEAQNPAGSAPAAWNDLSSLQRVIDFSQGPIERTENPFDLAISGDAFFTVATPSGEQYTRAGNFQVSSEGLLVTAQGYPVISDNGDIRITGEAFEVDQQGRIIIDGQVRSTLTLATFPQPYPLQQQEAGYFIPTPGAPAPQQATGMKIQQGALERANVNVITEMVNMIDSYRHFETAQRMVQTQDQSLEKTVNQLGMVR